MQQQQQQQPHPGMVYPGQPGHHGPMYPQAFHGPGPMMMPPQYNQPIMMMHPANPPIQAPLENTSFGQKILAEAKEPLLVSVLVMIMSSPQLQSLIARFLPISASNPLIGLAVRALVAGVLFYLLRRFIPSA
jgi:hypothetical protein